MSEYSRYAQRYKKRHNGRDGLVLDCAPGVLLMPDSKDLERMYREIEESNKRIEQEQEEEKRKIANQKIKAIEAMEAEKDPKIKERMRIYIEEGVYDFSGIRNI